MKELPWGLDWETFGQCLGTAGMLGGGPTCGKLRTSGKVPCASPSFTVIDWGRGGGGDIAGGDPLGPAMGKELLRMTRACPAHPRSPACFCRGYGEVNGLFYLARVLSLSPLYAPCPMARIPCAFSRSWASGKE